MGRLVFAPAGNALARTAEALVHGTLQQWLGDLLRIEDVTVEAEGSRLDVRVTYTPLDGAGDVVTAAASALSTGRFGLAINTALVAVRADVLRESVHHALIRAPLAEGDIGEVRRAFSVCTRLLERELGVSPSQETTALVDGRDAGGVAPLRPFRD